MKVGDLVKSAYSDNKAPHLGLIIEADGNGLGKHYKVLWGGYGTFWTPKDRLKLVQ